MVKVSIIVPIYNPGKKLKKCISSILNQTFDDFELILINDGSTDDSLKICKNFKKVDKRIIVIDKVNEGTVATRRKGIEVSKAEYVMFVDADDWIDKKMVGKLFNEVKSNNLDICVSNTILTLGNGIIKRENNSHLFKQSKIYIEDEIKKILATSYFQYGDAYPASLCSKLFKKELLISSGKYLNRIQFFGDDLFYNLEMLLKAKRVRIIGDSLYYYRMGGFTYKYMPYFFNDIINGYEIQKEVIDEYYIDNKQNHIKSINSTLLLMFRNGLNNLFYGDLSKTEIKNLIKLYVSNNNVVESINNINTSLIDELSPVFLDAIKKQDIDTLYSLGEDMFRKKKAKRVIKNILSNLSVG